MVLRRDGTTTRWYYDETISKSGRRYEKEDVADIFTTPAHHVSIIPHANTALTLANLALGLMNEATRKDLPVIDAYPHDCGLDINFDYVENPPAVRATSPQGQCKENEPPEMQPNDKEMKEELALWACTSGKVGKARVAAILGPSATKQDVKDAQVKASNISNKFFGTTQGNPL